MIVTNRIVLIGGLILLSLKEITLQSFDAENVKVVGNEYLEEVWRATYCLRRFMQSYLHRIEETPIFLSTSTPISPEINLILRSLTDGVIPAYVLSGKLEPNAGYSSSLETIILTDNSETLENDTIPNLSFLCSRNCVAYIVILSQQYEDEMQFNNDVKKLIKILWKRRIANVVAAAIIDGVFLFSRSRDFISDKPCTPDEPEILGVCCFESYDCQLIAKSVFSNIEANGCTLNTLIMPRIPYATIDPVTKNPSGIEEILMTAISSVVKFRYTPIGHDLGVFANSSQTMINNLFKKKKNIFFMYGGLGWNPDTDVDYTLPYDVTPIVWILPKNPQVTLRALISPLADEVWLALMALFIISIVYYHLFQHTTHGTLHLVALLLGISVPREPEKFSQRTFFITWALMGFVITQFYLVSLASDLLMPSHHTISNVRDLINSRIKLIVDNELSWVYPPNNNKSTLDGIIRDRITFKSMEEVNMIRHDLYEGKIQDTAILTMLNFSSPNSHQLSNNVYQMPLTIASSPLSIATWKGMPLLKAVDKTISSLIESGFIAHWSDAFVVKDNTFSNSRKTDVGLYELFPAFILLFIGYLLSVLALVLEILYRHIENRSIFHRKCSNGESKRFLNSKSVK